MIKYLAVLTLLPIAFTYGQPSKERLRIAREMEHSLKAELLEVWYPRSIDTANGGFTSAYTFDFKEASNQDKMIVTQARHVWTNSKASELYPNVDYYKKGATNGFYFLRNKMWDKVNGGFYSLTDRQGNVKTTIKEAYGNAGK